MFNRATFSNHPTLKRAFRFQSLLTGIFFAILTLFFLTQSPVAKSIWPWEYTTLSSLSFLFLGSITSAVAATTLWIAITGEVAAATTGSINLAVTFGGAGIFMIQTYELNLPAFEQRVLVAGISCVVITIGFLVAAGMVYPMKFRDTLAMPVLVRRSFLLFACVLILAGVLLLLKQPVFPWKLSGEASIVYGWIFLGAAVSFLYGWFRPLWSNAAGQLCGFLAYDLVLIFPFLARFGNSEPQFLLSLTIYTSVLIYSGGLAIYFHCFYPPTRFRWIKG